MKTYITKENWEKLEHMLMLYEIPYSVAFDSHWDGKSPYATYDRYITINPVVIQEEGPAE